MGKDDLKGDFTPFANCSNHFNAVDKTKLNWKSDGFDVFSRAVLDLAFLVITDISTNPFPRKWSYRKIMEKLHYALVYTAVGTQNRNILVIKK